MPGSARLPLAAAVLAAVCGCAHVGRMPNPLSALRKPVAEEKGKETAEAEPFKSAAEAETAEAEPAKQDGGPSAVAKAEDSKADAGKTEAATSGATPAESAAPAAETAGGSETAKTSGVVHDAETLALIESELREASPEDRAKLYEEFKTLDGEMIRQLVRINQMVRDLETSRAAGAALPVAAVPSERSAAAGPDGGSRVLNLGGATTAAPIPTVAGEPAAEIRPAGHSVAMAGTPVRTAAVGHSTTRPVPVLEALSTAGTDGGPPAAPAADGFLGVAANEAWLAQLRQLVTAAEGRAERARAAFLDRSPAEPASEPARRAYVESQVHLRLLYLMAGEQGRAMQAIPGIDAADQEFWQQVVWGVSNYFDEAALPNRADRTTQTVEQLRTAVARLQGEANLALRNVAFCHKITSFGSYEKFERDEYLPGQSVLLYVEVANFKSVPQPADGLFKTQLKSSIEFYRAGEGQPVSKMEFDPTTDLCRSYRQDYFQTYELKIPPTLTLGPHVLKLTVEDVQTGKLATYSVNFTVK